MHSISCNRTWALYQGMQKYFDHVHVLSTSNRHVLPKDEMDTSSVHITDAKTIDYRTVFQRKGKHAVAGEKTKTTLVGRTAVRLQNSFPTLYLFGEGNTLYIRNGIEAAEKIVRTESITHLMSTFPPYADHLIAANIKRRHPGLYWIADFRDLHVDPAQDNLFNRAYQKKVNRVILQQADLVTTVSEGLAVHLHDLHPHVEVLKNGIKPSGQPRELYPKFTLSYTGSMFQDKRKPDALLGALRQLIDQGILKESEVELIYAGKDSAVWYPMVDQFGLKSIFRDKGLVSRKEAEEIQQRSHFNILLTYSTEDLKGNLTGKLPEYLSAGRPILVLINGPSDPEIEAMIHDTNAGQVFYQDDVSQVAEYIARAYRKWKDSGYLEQEYSSAMMNTLTWPAILDTFMTRNPEILKLR